jgi:hypothetical protein
MKLAYGVEKKNLILKQIQVVDFFFYLRWSKRNAGNQLPQCKEPYPILKPNDEPEIKW